ncbi:MAG: DivIVA domain-containing protein [Ignavibacteriaceae bacterium]
MNIKAQEFTKTMRGYDVEEVRAFLEKLSNEMENILQENDSVKKELIELKDEITEYKKIEKNLQDTLLKAQETSSKSLETTKKQTGVMIKEAELKASQIIIENAKGNAIEIKNAVNHLREERDLIISKLKAIVNSQANLLEVKVEQAGKESENPSKSDSQKDFDVDVDGIVDKL